MAVRPRRVTAGGRRAALLLGLVAAPGLSAGLLGPSPVVPQAPQRPTFHVNVDLVAVDVSVTRNKLPVAGLTRSNFAVYDNGARQQLQPVSVEQVPLDAWLVLDTSKSVEKGLPNLEQAGSAFMDGLSSRDRGGLVAFSQTVRVPQMLTPDLDAVRHALRGLSASGATALYDATYVALRLRQPSNTRGVALILTDGFDNTSWLTADRLVQLAERSDLLVYGVSISPPTYDGIPSGTREPPGTPQFRFLRRLADATGGRVFNARWSELKTTFAGILRDIRTRYLLTYYPTSTAPGWHKLDVKLTGARGDVTARNGYWVAAPR